VQIIETWQANSSTENTSTTLKHVVVMVTHSFAVVHLISILSDFQLEKKHYTRPQTQANIILFMLVGSCISGTICNYEN